MANDGEVFDVVQASLLESECSPKYAVERALLAVQQFAYCEAEMGLIEFLNMAADIWHAHDLGSPNLGRK